MARPPTFNPTTRESQGPQPKDLQHVLDFFRLRSWIHKLRYSNSVPIYRVPTPESVALALLKRLLGSHGAIHLPKRQEVNNTKKLENTRFQIKEISELTPVNSNVKYAQITAAEISVVELGPVRSNVKYAQVAN